HMSIDYNGILCPCGSRGCLELYASGTAMNRRMRSDCEKKIPSSLFAGTGYDPDRINGALLGKAAKENDAYALEFFRQEGRYLGAGLANLFNLFDPDVIVLGGGVTKSAEFFEEEMLAEVNRRSCLPVARERIRFSELNDRVTLYGAYFLINDYLQEEGGAGRERKE
ncbi:MAG: ROK family protein, partial [Lachnospiraceae bacterium]|nr:ROK family protein [Lachnospiraceae bacterium]